MARTKIDLMSKNIRFYIGDSSEIKPTENVASNARFHECDTGTNWICDIEKINPTTSNGWWEIK
jgi:hypothetical protein